MAEQFLHRADIGPALQQMRRKAVPKRMAADPLGKSARLHRLLHFLLKRVLVHMVPHQRLVELGRVSARRPLPFRIPPRIDAQLARRKQILPPKLPRRPGHFSAYAYGSQTFPWPAAKSRP